MKQFILLIMMTFVAVAVSSSSPAPLTEGQDQHGYAVPEYAPEIQNLAQEPVANFDVLVAEEHQGYEQAANIQYHVPVSYAVLQEPDEGITLPPMPDQGSPITSWITWAIAVIGILIGYIVGRRKKEE